MLHWLYIQYHAFVAEPEMEHICRSILSKLVGPEDVGKIYSVLAVCQSLLPLAGVPFFGFLYRATVGKMDKLTFNNLPN